MPQTSLWPDQRLTKEAEAAGYSGDRWFWRDRLDNKKLFACSPNVGIGEINRSPRMREDVADVPYSRKFGFDFILDNAEGPAYRAP